MAGIGHEELELGKSSETAAFSHWWQDTVQDYDPMRMKIYKASPTCGHLSGPFHGDGAHSSLSREGETQSWELELIALGSVGEDAIQNSAWIPVGTWLRTEL
jgi:hypothetical protein